MKNFFPMAGLLLVACPLVTDADHQSRIDVDGDGFVAVGYPGGTDCDDRDENVGEGDTWFLDADGDGFGDVNDGVVSCTTPQGRVADSSDCDDTAAMVRPSAAELCNGLDDDCDGVRDEGLTLTPAFPDADGDGYGVTEGQVEVCAAPQGFVVAGGDCDDSDASVAPNVDERCNGIDDDCDNAIDEELPQSTFYADVDGDGFGDPAVVETLCAAVDGFVTDNTDCDDGTAAVSPGASEQCNGVDDDCDGLADEGLAPLRLFYPDADADGFGDDSGGLELCAAPVGWTSVPGDCDDAEALISPDGVEDCATDGDEDCDPSTACGPRGDMVALGVSWFSPEVLEWETGSSLATVQDGSVTHIAVGAREYDRSAGGSDGAFYIAQAPQQRGRVLLADAAFIRSDRHSFGHSLVDVPDMDGDGVRDFASGAPLTSFGGGRVFVVSSRSGDVLIPSEDDPILQVQPEDDWAYLGYALASGGDLTGDGVEDIVIGAPLSGSGNNAERGRVAVFSGLARDSRSVDDATSNIRGDRGDRAGWSVAILPDFNGDGNPDLAVGAPLDDASGLDSGTVGVFFGPLSDGRTNWNNADAYYFGLSAGDLAGASIAYAGDVNGDGLSDLMIGAPGRSEGGFTSRGAVYIVHGSDSPGTYTLGSADATFLGDSPLRFMGDSVARAGDVDGNGLDDVLMGQPRAIENRGRGILQMAPFDDSPRVTPDGYVQSTHPDHVVGWAVAPAGDVNADGYDDFLISARGAVPAFFDDGSAILIYGQP